MIRWKSTKIRTISSGEVVIINYSSQSWEKPIKFFNLGNSTDLLVKIDPIGLVQGPLAHFVPNKFALVVPKFTWGCANTHSFALTRLLLWDVLQNADR